MTFSSSGGSLPTLPELAHGSDKHKHAGKLPVKHSHYYRLCPYPHIDVYRVLELFEVTDPALQHIIKKALCAGQRGAKDFRKDLEEIVDTGNRRIEMLDEDTEHETSRP